MDGLVVRWLFVSIHSIKKQILGLVGLKSSNMTDYCLSSWFVHQKLNTYSTLFVLCRFSHLSWFQGLKYIPPSFWPQVTNHDVKSNSLKKWFLRSLVFYTTFSWCWKIEEITKNICRGHTKILVCTTYRVIIWKILSEATNVSTLVKFFSVGKSWAHISWSNWLTLFLCQGCQF